MKTRNFFPLLLICLFLHSCIKDNSNAHNAIGNSLKTRVSVPFYNDEDEATSELLRRMDLRNQGIEALDHYEDLNGYTSLGRACDDLYFQILEDSLNYTQQTLLAAIANSPLRIALKIEDGDTMFVPRYRLIPERYLANEDGLFQVEECVYRVFEKGIVSVKINDLDHLIELQDDEDLFDLDSTIFHFEALMELSVPNPVNDTVIENNQSLGGQRSTTVTYYATTYSSIVGYDYSPIPHAGYYADLSPQRHGYGDSRKYKIVLSMIIYGRNTIFNGKRVESYVRCESYKKSWLFGAYIWNPSDIELHLRATSCVDDKIVKLSLDEDELPSSYERILYTAKISNAFATTKKYIHWRGCKSNLITTEIPNGALLVFGDQTYLND